MNKLEFGPYMYSIHSQLYHDKPDKTDYEMLQCIYIYPQYFLVM